LRKRLPSEADVEDVLQQATLRALAASESLEEPDRVRAWLYRIVQHTLVDSLRSEAAERRRRGEAWLWYQEPDEPREPGCDCSLELLLALRPDYSKIITMADLREIPVQQVAAELGITRNNAAVRLHRARRALRREVMAHCDARSFEEALECECPDPGAHVKSAA
jgi:RNA polymerase sigma-70 factor (ECF subfamily)